MPVSGAKNSALKLMAATLLAPGKTTLRNVPDISDVHVMGKVLKGMGATIDVLDEHTLEIDTSQVDSWEAPYELVAKMRASTAVMGPLLGRFHRAKIAMPGGCNLGARKIDMHILGLEALGVEFDTAHGYINANAPQGLRGTTVTLEFASVGATENLIMASVRAQGTTVIDNAAREPEIEELQSFLRLLGAEVEGAGTATVCVRGFKPVQRVGHRIMPDRIVSATLLCAVAAPHVYEAVTATFTCAGNTFTAKGKTILTPGWKELDRRFKASFKTDSDDTAPEPARELPEITEGQTFDKVTAAVTEHFTAPPKSYTEDTLLSAMERAGTDDLPEDAERQGLGTPATRASILEKLVQMGFVERRGKQLVPTKDGHNLACVLPEVLTSPQLTAQWETELTAIAKGQADPEGFMAGIAEMTRGLIANYSQISEDAQKLFQTERVVIGKCPRCGESVYEGKKNYYCGNRSCQFVMWKNDRFFEERGKAFTPKIAAALLKDGKAKVKGLRSMKTGKTYDGTVLLADTGGKYVNYRVEQRDKN